MFLKGKSAYFLIELKTPEYLKMVQEMDINQLFIQKEVENINTDELPVEKVQKIFSISINPVNFHKKIVIINFSTSVLKSDPYHPKVHLEGLIQGIWFNN